MVNQWGESKTFLEGQIDKPRRSHTEIFSARGEIPRNRLRVLR